MSCNQKPYSEVILVKRCLLLSLLVLMLLPGLTTRLTYAQNNKRSQQPTVEQILSDMAEALRHKVSDEYFLAAQINIQPELESGYVDIEKPALESWHVIMSPGKNVVLKRGAGEKMEIIFYTTARALSLMSSGKMNSNTAIAASKSSDPVFMRWERPPGVESTPELRAKVRVFQLQFFNPSLPQRFILDSAHARWSPHGANVVLLYYYPGFRSAWFEVRRGKTLNKPGDKDPLHQAFIFISGDGMAKIGDKTIKVQVGQSYYIPPNSDHVVWTKKRKPLVLIWLAWGEGA